MKRIIKKSIASIIMCSLLLITLIAGSTSAATIPSRTTYLKGVQIVRTAPTKIKVLTLPALSASNHAFYYNMSGVLDSSTYTAYIDYNNALKQGIYPVFVNTSEVRKCVKGTTFTVPKSNKVIIGFLEGSTDTVNNYGARAYVAYKESFVPVPKVVGTPKLYPLTTKNCYVTAKYTKATGAAKYQLAYKIGKTGAWKKVKTVNNALRLPKLAKGSVVYVTVRGINSNNTSYGAWATAQKIVVR